jgi:CheY-like chemotaxis protein
VDSGVGGRPAGNVTLTSIIKDLFGTIEALSEGVPSKRILVVDDDGAILRLVAAILKRELYDVDTASGGKEALAKIELTRYDVVVLDLMMPEVSGLDVLRRLAVRLPQIKCVVLLSAASPLDIASRINPNVFAALQKPFDNAALIAAVRGCIEASCDPATPALLPEPVPRAA